MNGQIRFFNRLSKTADSRVTVHEHQCYELVYYQSAFGTTKIGSRKYPIGPQTVALIPPHTPHDEAHQGPAELIFIGFEEMALAKKIGEGVFSVNEQRMFFLLKEIIREATEQLPGYEVMLSAKLSEILVTLSRLKSGAVQERKDLCYISNYLDENYSRSINFSELAALCGYSYDYFRHLFKKRTGQSPQEYLICQRLSHAKELLKTTALTCTEISYHCGFSNSAQFSTMFKKYYHISPKAYQLSHRR